MPGTPTPVCLLRQTAPAMAPSCHSFPTWPRISQETNTTNSCPTRGLAPMMTRPSLTT
ncbi:hypothetical protein BC831DRAFT_472747 [Entophlyctis helioformis]|nr:hypothetical protein BC831DRAFT_472747 [Entophlyctis helioformis]